MHFHKSGPAIGRSIAAFIATALGITLSQAEPSQALYQTIFYDGFESDFNQQWTVSNGYSNGSPFGCAWSYSEVWKTNSGSNGFLNVNLNGGTTKCGEVKSKRSFRYGSFVTNMKPLNTAGTISSFFLYTGTTGGAQNHFEIDIEFIGGTNKLHTNYWIAGKQETNNQPHWQDIDLSTFGINPYSQFRRYGFEWRSNKIVWFTYNDLGVWVKLREVNASVNVDMPIFINNWNGDNSPSGQLFPGFYSGGGGSAQYDFVWIGD
jgi:endo-1,3-1,4-beta-glycanase ExoK